jgi:DNA-binding CsgD family transcriptional regulator
MAKEPAAPSRAATPHQPAQHDEGPLDGTPRILWTGLQTRPRGDHSAEAVLDKLNRGIVILDQEARVRFLNDAAMQLIHQTAAIAVVDGRLVFTDAGSQARLLAFLQQGRGADVGSAQHSVVMRVEAGVNRAPYRVLLSGLRTPATTASGGRDARYVLMIYEPHAGRHVARRILTELYGLSEAESGLALLLFQGETLERAAQRLHVSVNTAKTHLQHVFTKCDVHSQGELLQLLSLGPRTL